MDWTSEEASCASVNSLPPFWLTSARSVRSLASSVRVLWILSRNAVSRFSAWESGGLPISW